MTKCFYFVDNGITNHKISGNVERRQITSRSGRTAETSTDPMCHHPGPLLTSSSSKQLTVMPNHTATLLVLAGTILCITDVTRASYLQATKEIANMDSAESTSHKEVRRSQILKSEQDTCSVMHQSIPAAPIPPPGNRGAFTRIVSRGGRALANPRATPGLLTPRGF